jgi:AhpC/TSA family protein
MHRRSPLAAALIALACAAPALHADILRESTGAHRAQLDKMELQAFPADAWSKLTAWTGGDALTAGATDGKPVLIMTWASWHPASLKSLGLAQKMADKFGPQGLIVVGVHNTQGWAEAAETAKTRGAKFLLAHDSAGEFRKALSVDHDPSFYFVDRAGHLRYAAVASSSVEEACTELVGETQAQASDLPALVKKRTDDATAKGRMTTVIRPQIDLSTLPAVPPGFVQPPESAYKAASWPKIDEEVGKAVGILDNTGKNLEPKLAFAPAGYYPAKPETQGRAMVIYLWHPDEMRTFTTAMSQMDLLQQQNARDLAVIGAMVPKAKLDANSNNSGQETESAEKLTQKYQAFVGSRSYRHALAADLSGSSLTSLSGQGGGNKFPLPGAMVVSSDGIIRWVGWSNSSDFKYAVDTVLANDPAVQARRAADRAFIENRTK